MSNIILIFLLSSVLYYLSLVGVTKSEFKKSNVDIPFLSSLVIPIYILNEVRKVSYSETPNLLKFLKRIPLYSLYLVIYVEVVYFSLESNTIVGLKHKLKSNSLFNPKVKIKFLELLKGYIVDTQ